jgi:CRP/FNR family transcriptional regulator
MTLDHPSLSELRPEGEHLPNGDHSASRSAPAPLAQPLLSTLCDLYELLGQAHPRLSGFENVNVSARRVRMGHVLFHEGANASHIHFVRVGAFKCVQTAEDGYEQVLSFSFKGETLGFDALGNGHHPCSALALEDSTVLSVPAQEVLEWGQKVPELNYLMSLAVSRELTRRSDIAGMMAAVGAEVRLARFCCTWAGAWPLSGAARATCTCA